MRRNLVLLLIACAVLTGCFYASGSREQNTFSNAAVKKIERGKTTKEDILKWFGPPLAIARKGDEDKTMTAENVRADTFLEPFSAKRPLTEDDVVYYYHNVETSTSDMGFLYAMTSKSRSAYAMLWIRIDNRNGIVEDYLTRQRQ